MLQLEHKTILVTGATGFLAKIFVEKILRIQPNVKKLYLVLRASNSISATKRFQDEVVGKEVFRVLKNEWGANFEAFVSERVVAVAGDVSSEGMGIEDHHLKEAILNETDIILNFAATTNFFERYDVALGTNTFGALHVLNFSKKCAKIKLLVHISTAYVCGEEGGNLVEKPVCMGERTTSNILQVLDAEKELLQNRLHQLLHPQNLEIASAMQNIGLERARFYGWPNTYTFTKALGEMVMVELKGDLPLVIIRPTMITSTLKHPFPGWLEGAKTIDGAIVRYAKGRLKCLAHKKQVIFDLIPADMVVNGIIGVMGMAFANQHLDLIYHLGSSMKNPITLSDIINFSFAFFTKHPWRDNHGKPVKVAKVTTFSSMASFHAYMAIRFQLPLKILGLVNAGFGHKWEANYLHLLRKFKTGMRMIELYKPYFFFEGIFDDTNLEGLRKKAREIGLWEEQNMDTRSINWEEYIMNVHIPGIVQFAME